MVNGTLDCCKTFEVGEKFMTLQFNSPPTTHTFYV